MISRGRRPESVWLSRSAGRGDAGGVADAGPQPRRAWSIASTASATPTARRWRWSIPPCRASACRREMAVEESLYEALDNARRAARCGRCSGCGRCCSPPSGRGCWGCRTARPGLLIERRGFLRDGRAGGVHPELLSRRRLRLRRRAQHLGLLTAGASIESRRRSFGAARGRRASSREAAEVAGGGARPAGRQRTAAPRPGGPPARARRRGRW